MQTVATLQVARALLASLSIVACGSESTGVSAVTISSITPLNGPETGGTAISVTGANFPATIENVFFGSTPASSFEIVSATTATVITPPHAPGVVAVTVEVSPGVSVTTQPIFTYETVAPGSFALTSISRDAVSTDGGVTIYVNGGGFEADASITVDGVPATTEFVSSAQLRFIAPALSAGLRSVTVTQSDGSATLNNSLEYLPAPTFVHLSHDFEDGLFGSWGTETVGDAAIAVTDEVARSGTHSVRMSRTNGSTSRLTFRYTTPVNPPLDATGLYQRWYVRAPQSTLTNVLPGQIKWLLNRPTAGTGRGWMDIGIGNEFSTNLGGNEIIGLMDYQNTRLDPSGPSDSRTGVVMLPDSWYEVQTWFRRTGGVGHIKLWINGKKRMDTSHANMGGDSPEEAISFWLGIAFSQSVDGPLVLFVDETVAANGFIDPVP